MKQFCKTHETNFYLIYTSHAHSFNDVHHRIFIYYEVFHLLETKKIKLCDLRDLMEGD